MSSNNTKYIIEVVGPEDIAGYALPSSTDAQAKTALTKWLKANPLCAGHKVFLHFYRQSDGQSGYINSDGACVTGTPWNVE